MFVGTYSATKIEADDKYRLLGGNDGTVIANVSEAGTLKGTRCYFLFPSGSQPVNKSIGLDLPTAIPPHHLYREASQGSLYVARHKDKRHHQPAFWHLRKKRKKVHYQVNSHL